MGFEHIRYEKSEGVATITMNRPEKRNALVLEMRQEIAAAIADARSDDAVRALLITGAGGFFSAGGDLKRMAQGYSPVEARALVHKVVPLVVGAILSLEKPVVSAVSGPAVGAGMSLAIACDIAFAAEDATFSQAFVRIGAVPDNLGFFLLPRLVGLQKTKELMFTGDTIDAQEAHRLGLVSRVLPREQLLPEAFAFAKRLADGPTQTIGLTKALVHRSLTLDVAGALELEALGQAVVFSTEDHREGLHAILEKRPPKFKGR